MSAQAVSRKGWGNRCFLARMRILWATKMSTVRTQRAQRCHCDLEVFFCNLRFVQARKGPEIDAGTRSGVYLLIREGVCGVCAWARACLGV